MKLKIFAIVPAKQFEKGKSRLATLLDIRDRVKLGELLLDSTLHTLENATAIYSTVVISTDERAKRIAKMHGAIFVDEGKQIGVNNAVNLANDYCARAGAVATVVVPQDLPLALSEDIDMICNSAKEYDRCLIICPSSRFDGSNVLLRRPPKLIDSHYDNNSFNMHINAAKKIGAKIKIILSQRMMLDLDTLEDAQYLAKEPRTCKPLVYLRSKLNEVV
ncbi:MAG TPA: 2-phospho-L-lactate guanylyltransferase [Nitrososphaeraceae archaeon]|nr:2-phospho-L-lactate guanylyltransferase [Nitrososphaeraceae archaeon]